MLVIWFFVLLAIVELAGRIHAVSRWEDKQIERMRR